MNSIFISLIALAVTMAGLVQYFRTIPRNRVPEKPILLILFLITGILISGYALFMGIPGSVWSVVGVVIPAVMSIFFGVFILWLLTQRKTPIGDIKVKVGDTMLPFTATTSNGETFNTD